MAVDPDSATGRREARQARPYRRGLLRRLPNVLKPWTRLSAAAVRDVCERDQHPAGIFQLVALRRRSVRIGGIVGSENDQAPKKRKPKLKLTNPEGGQEHWVRLRDAENMVEKMIVRELQTLAVSFATHPDKTWSGEQLAIFFHDQMVRRRKYGLWNVVDEDDLPRGHAKLV